MNKNTTTTKKKYIRKKPCFFCYSKITYVDYKDVDLVTKYINIHGKIIARRVTGNCSLHQRVLARAIKRSRIMALIPFTKERIRH